MELTITLIIIIITVIISFTAFNNQKVINDLIFYPPAVADDGQWWRFFSSGLIHADTAHLIFNMLSLYFFGPAIESAFETSIFGEHGKWVYLLLYVTALFVSMLPTYLKHKHDTYYRSLGASGAVSAIIFTGLMIAPGSEVGLIFIPFVRIPGFIFAPLYLILSAYLDRRGADNINHSAHIWGGLYGLAFIIIAGILVDFNAIEECIEGIKYYMRAKGWIA
jgi:membrane associated rhomboid family serine protease